MRTDTLDSKIRCFLKIAKHSSLSQAADEIGIGQSALSRQLAALESFIQKPLFERTGHGIKLTDAGEKLRSETQSHYDKIDAAITYILEKEGITDGKLRIATTYTIGLSFVSGLLDAFMSQQAGINLSITSSGSPNIVELVEKKVVDIGFLYDSAVASSLVESAPLFDNKMCLIARRGDVDESLEVDLLNRKLALVSYPPTYALREMLKSARLEDRIVAEANTLDVILQLVASGVGQCILPDCLPDRTLAEHDLVKIRSITPVLRRRVVAIIRRNTATLLAKRLFDMAREGLNSSSSI